MLLGFLFYLIFQPHHITGWQTWLRREIYGQQQTLTAGCEVFCISLHHLIIGWTHSDTKEQSSYLFQWSQTRIFNFFQDQAPLVLVNCFPIVFIFFCTVHTNWCSYSTTICPSSWLLHQDTISHPVQFITDQRAIKKGTKHEIPLINSYLKIMWSSVNWKQKHNFSLRKTPASEPLYSHYALTK